MAHRVSKIIGTGVGWGSLILKNLSIYNYHILSLFLKILVVFNILVIHVSVLLVSFHGTCLVASRKSSHSVFEPKVLIVITLMFTKTLPEDKVQKERYFSQKLWIFS